MNDQNHMHEQPVEPETDEVSGECAACAGSGPSAALPIGLQTTDIYGGWIWSTLGRRKPRSGELPPQPAPLTEKLVRDDGHTQVYQRSDGLMSAYTYDGAKEGSDQPMLDRDQAERDQAERRFKAAMGEIAAHEKQLIEETCGITGVMRGASAAINCQAEADYHAKLANEKRAALERSFMRAFNEVLNSPAVAEAYAQAFHGYIAGGTGIVVLKDDKATFMDVAQAAKARALEFVQGCADADEAVAARMRAQEQASGTGALRGAQAIMAIYQMTGERPKLPALPAHYHFDDVGARVTGRAQRLYISMKTGEVLHTVWQAALEDWPELADGAPWGTYSSALTPEQYKKVLASTKYKDTSLAQRALTKVINSAHRDV